MAMGSKVHGPVIKAADHGDGALSWFCVFDERPMALKTDQIKPHFANNRNDTVYLCLPQRIFAQSPIDPAKFTAIIPPVDGGCATHPDCLPLWRNW